MNIKETDWVIQTLRMFRDAKTNDHKKGMIDLALEKINQLEAENERLGKELDEQQKINVTLESFI